MTEQERLKIQGQKIQQLKDENEELREGLRILLQENEVLKKNKTELELDLIKQNEKVEGYIEQYQTLIEQIEKIRDGYAEAKHDYVESIVDAKKKIHGFERKHRL